MARIAKRILLAACLLLAAVYASDYLSLRYRIPGSREPFGTVQVERYYAVPQKNGKTEFLFDQTETQKCVHSLFPHFGDNPCWYVSRHKQKRIDM